MEEDGGSSDLAFEALAFGLWALVFGFCLGFCVLRFKFGLLLRGRFRMNQRPKDLSPES